MLQSAAILTAAGAVASWAYLRHIMLPVGPSCLNWSQNVIAHRGARFVDGIPENTVPAFQYAAANCASGLECDIRQCKTGELMVFHDPKLGNYVQDPEFQGRKIRDLTFDELRKLHLSEDTKGLNVTIPTLDEVIEVCREHDLRLLIEMKTIPGASAAENQRFVDSLVKTFEKHDDFLYEHALVISFNPILLYKLRRKEPRIGVIILSKPKIATDLIADKMEAAPAFMRPLPGLADHAMHFLLHSVSPWVIGASGVGMPYSSFRDSDVHMWGHRKKLVYLWGFPDPSSCIASMRSNGVAVAVDDDYGQYFLRPRFPMNRQ